MENHEGKKMNKRGSEDSFKTIVFGLIAFAGFTWLLLSIAINIGEEYGKDTTDIGNGSFKASDYKQSIEGLQENTSVYSERFEDGGGGDDVDDVSGIFSILTDIKSVIVTPFTLLSSMLNNVFNIPTTIINMILGMLGLAIIYGIWRIVRAGA